MNNRKLATHIANSERYVGGYLYGGTQTSIIAQGWAPDQLQYPIHSTRNYDKTPTQVMAAHNKRLLALVPVGSIVSQHTSTTNGQGWAEWIKTGPCKWVLTEEGWEERE
jgi:uncharacterized protein involved in copper resistance